MLQVPDDVVVEINTAARRRVVETNGDKSIDFYPCSYIIREVLKKKPDFKFCLSSDAHFLKYVCFYFREAIEFLEEVGVQRLHYFEAKQLRSYTIAEARRSFKTVEPQEWEQLMAELQK